MQWQWHKLHCHSTPLQTGDLAAAVAGKDYNYEDDYLKQTYNSYGYQGEDEASKPKCGPKQFDELKEATTCLDVESGEYIGGCRSGLAIVRWQS
jgi:hypothetical protein